jgi:hypothetical protein
MSAPVRQSSLAALSFYNDEGDDEDGSENGEGSPAQGVFAAVEADVISVRAPDGGQLSEQVSVSGVESTPWRFTPTPAAVSGTPSWSASAAFVDAAAAVGRADDENNYADMSNINALLPPSSAEVDPEMKVCVCVHIVVLCLVTTVLTVPHRDKSID